VSADVVLTDASDGVLTITIDRPQVRNALDLATTEALAAALDQLDADADLYVGILTGANGIFCAGMDLKAFLSGERPVIAGRGFGGLTEAPPVKPLIAAVEGLALGGGFELALACDLIVAAEDVRLGLPEVRRGLIAAAGGVLRLPRQIPYHLAMEFVLTGKDFDAERARDWGLVNRVSPPGGALALARELAKEIRANGPLAVQASKRLIVESADWTLAEAFGRQREYTTRVMQSADAAEGARAFAETRPPVWVGR
jgi:enoyl-CoA hydratase